MTAFSKLGLIEPLVRAVRDSGYTDPTPIQTQAIPVLLEGRDLLGCAKTGTGKTAAFALPILQRLANKPERARPRSTRVLVVTPTRELAAQVAESFNTYGARLQLSVAVIFGGVGQGNQVKALARGIDILVATPGRLLDLKSQGHLKLDAVEVLVLDEADQMLDMGFIPDVRRILASIPRNRQTLLFSATMPPTIAKLAESILHEPVRVTVTPPASTVELITQSVYFVSRAAKPGLLTKLLSAPEVERALVFTRTKRGADRVAKRLEQDGIPANAIHGNKSQGQRERTLEAFRDGRSRVLVATDIAARGIDIDDISHVINYEIPNVPEQYVHRIGRTGRAGASGAAISLCDGDERAYIEDIERLTRRKIPVASTPGGDRPERSHRADRPERSERAHDDRRAPRAPAHKRPQPAHPSPARTSSTSTSHGPARTPHAPTRTSHGPARTPHAPTSSSHAPTRSSHAPTRSSHAPTRGSHAPTRSSHAPTRSGASHGQKPHAPTSSSGRGASHAPRTDRSSHSPGGFGDGV